MDSGSDVIHDRIYGGGLKHLMREAQMALCGAIFKTHWSMTMAKHLSESHNVLDVHHSNFIKVNFISVSLGCTLARA